MGENEEEVLPFIVMEWNTSPRDVLSMLEPYQQNPEEASLKR